MTGDQLRAIRLELGLSPSEFGAALGFQGKAIRSTIRELEHGKNITPRVARLVLLVKWYVQQNGRLPF